eukprot:scaffold4875_cov67-Phaeocystis_antarctica.AAC.1
MCAKSKSAVVLLGSNRGRPSAIGYGLCCYVFAFWRGKVPPNFPATHVPCWWCPSGAFYSLPNYYSPPPTTAAFKSGGAHMRHIYIEFRMHGGTASRQS